MPSWLGSLNEFDEANTLADKAPQASTGTAGVQIAPPAPTYEPGTFRRASDNLAELKMNAHRIFADEGMKRISKGFHLLVDPATLSSNIWSPVA